MLVMGENNSMQGRHQNWAKKKILVSNEEVIAGRWVTCFVHRSLSWMCCLTVPVTDQKIMESLPLQQCFWNTLQWRDDKLSTLILSFLPLKVFLVLSLLMYSNWHVILVEWFCIELKGSVLAGTMHGSSPQPIPVPSLAMQEFSCRVCQPAFLAWAKLSLAFYVLIKIWIQFSNHRDWRIIPSTPVSEREQAIWSIKGSTITRNLSLHHLESCVLSLCHFLI